MREQSNQSTSRLAAESAREAIVALAKIILEQQAEIDKLRGESGDGELAAGVIREPGTNG